MRYNVSTMSQYDKTRFRITPWPEVKLPLPGAHQILCETYFHQIKPLTKDELAPLEDLDDDDFADELRRLDRLGRPYEDIDYLTGPQGPFGEVYLELFELDLDDVYAARDFVLRWSVLGVYSPEWAPAWSHHYLGFCDVPAFAQLGEELREVANIHGSIPPPFPPEEESWDEFRLGAMCLRDMTTAWLVVQGRLDEEEAEWVTPCWSNAVEGSLDPRALEAKPLTVLHCGLRPALQPFAPQVRILDEKEEFPTAGLGSGLPIPFYSLCCAELFNHIVEEAEYKTCANETCGRLFVRQRGRALHGQHRSKGVKYCSAECAKAQAQRVYRRRKKTDSERSA